MTGISPDWQPTGFRRRVGEAICIVERLVTPQRGGGVRTWWVWGVWLPHLSSASATGRESSPEKACAAAEQAAQEAVAR